jgi:hypothetical protein
MSQVKWDELEAVYGHPINSGIAFPQEGQVVKKGDKIEIKGWAHGDGTKGTQATQVELSFDNGQTWRRVNSLMMEDKPPGRKVFSWTLWNFVLDTSALPGESVSV